MEHGRGNRGICGISISLIFSWLEEHAELKQWSL
jgi:hypothetical protein